MTEKNGMCCAENINMGKEKSVSNIDERRRRRSHSVLYHTPVRELDKLNEIHHVRRREHRTPTDTYTHTHTQTCAMCCTPSA